MTTTAIPCRPIERINDISLEQLRDHVEMLKPVIFRENGDTWPMPRWTPEAMIERYGDRVVRILDADVEYEGRDEEQSLIEKAEDVQTDISEITLERLVHRVLPPSLAPKIEPVLFPLIAKARDKQAAKSKGTGGPAKSKGMSATTYAKMGDAHRLVDFLDLIFSTPTRARIFLGDIAGFIPDASEGLKSIDFIRRYGYDQSSMRPGRINWFAGGKGATTPMHHAEDWSSSFLCQLYGRKQVILFPYDQTPRMYRAPFSVASPVDPIQGDFKRFPKFKKVEAYEAILDPGDTLHIPCGWWHFVHYFEPSFSLGNRFYVRSGTVPLEKRYSKLLEWKLSARRFKTYFINYPVDIAMESRFGEERWRRWKGARVHAPDLFLLPKEKVRIDRRRRSGKAKGPAETRAPK